MYLVVVVLRESSFSLIYNNVPKQCKCTEHWCVGQEAPQRRVLI